MADAQHQPLLIDARNAADAQVEATPARSEHSVQFYEDESFLLETVARFLGAGLVADEPVVVIATEPHRRAFHDTLVAKGFDVGRAMAAAEGAVRGPRRSRGRLRRLGSMTRSAPSAFRPS